MIFERLGEMFEGDFVDKFDEKIPMCQWGDEHSVKCAQTGNEDPKRCPNIIEISPINTTQYVLCM